MGFDPVSAAMIGGSALQAGSTLFGASQQAKTAKRAAAAANARYQDTRSMGLGLMSNSPDDFTKGLLDFTKTRSAPTLDPSTIDWEGVLKGSGLNAGNDSIMQYLRSDPTKQMGSAMSRLSSMGDTNPFDTGGQVSALQTVNDITNRANLNRINSNVTGLGQRGGTARGMASASYMRGAAADEGNTIAGINRDAYSQNQNLRLNALTTLGGLQGQDVAQRLQAAGLLNESGLNTANLRMQGSQFNANARNTTAQTNAQNALQFMQQQLAALSSGAQSEATRRNYNAGIFGTISGQPGPATAQTGQVAGAVGDIGNLVTLLPFLMQLNKKTPTTTVAARP